MTQTAWQDVQLGDIGQSLIGLTYSPNNVRRSGTLVLRSSNIQNGQLALYDNVYVNSAIPDKIRICENDILICVRNGSRNLIGKSVLLDQRVVNQTFGAFMAVYRSEFNPFLQYFFQSGSFKRQIDEHLGATINQITNGSLNSFVVALPPVEEQKIITEKLRDLDNLIVTLERTISKKQSIKLGMMQQLLTGRLRLSGFTDEWHKTTYKDVVMIQRGDVFIGRDALSTGAIPVIAAGKMPAAFTDRANRTGPVITISASGASAGYVAWHKSAIFASDCSTISSGSSYDLRFIYFSLALRQEQLYRAQTGGAQPHVHSKDIYPMELCLPSDIAEQSAIAKVLAESDAELDVLRQQLLKTRDIKTGMIQQLLTGATRLTEVPNP